MIYIIVQFKDGTAAYRECDPQGNIVRYTDVNGNSINTNETPVEIVDGNPQFPSWGLPDPVNVVVEPSPIREIKEITKYQYINLFTDNELVTIYTAAKSLVQLEIWLEKFRVAEIIDLKDPKTIEGLQALEAAGLLAVGRAQEILNA